MGQVSKSLKFSTTQPYSSLVFTETFALETNLVNEANGLTESMCPSNVYNLSLLKLGHFHYIVCIVIALL